MIAIDTNGKVTLLIWAIILICVVLLPLVMGGAHKFFARPERRKQTTIQRKKSKS